MNSYQPEVIEEASKENSSESSGNGNSAKD